MQTAAANRPAARSSNPLAGAATGQLAPALLIAAVAIGCVLRLWQYLTDTSLWLDEIALARGILDLDLRSLLLQPLPYDQVAPKGFLLVQKLAVLALGRSDYILRLFPFLSSVV